MTSPVSLSNPTQAQREEESPKIQSGFFLKKKKDRLKIKGNVIERKEGKKNVLNAIEKNTMQYYKVRYHLFSASSYSIVLLFDHYMSV